MPMLPPLPGHLSEDFFEDEGSGSRARVIQVDNWPKARFLHPHLCTPAAAPVTAFVLSLLELGSYDSFPVVTPVEVARNSDEWDEMALDHSQEFITPETLRDLRASGYRFPTSLDRDVRLLGQCIHPTEIEARLQRLRPRPRALLQRALALCQDLGDLKVTTERENPAVQAYLDRVHPDPLYAASLALEPYISHLVEHAHECVQQGGDERYPVSIWDEGDPAYRTYRHLLPKKVFLVQRVLDLLSA